MRFVKLAPSVLLLLATTLGFSAAQLPAPPASAPVQAPRAAAPAAPASPPSAAVLDLRADLSRIVREPGWRSAEFGVIVVSLDRGDTLFALNPDLPLAPASNMKLYSTAAALYYLGPDFRYSTFALAAGEVVNGTLIGDLLLYGTGDPSISRRMLSGSKTALNQLADSLAARGIREVQGNVVGDGSYFDDAWIGRDWDDDDRMAWYAAPVGALSFAENMISVRVLPGDVGGAAQIRTAPETRGLSVSNAVRTVARGGTHVRYEHGPRGLVLTGQIQRGHPGIARSLPVVDPGNYAAAAFREVLEERGIAVTGEVRTVTESGRSPVGFVGSAATVGGAAPPRVLAVYSSPPLAEIASVTNHISHNLFAEALLKTVGRVALGDGSFEGGSRAIRYFLECEAGADSASLHIVDGSGLSKTNRVTARTTVELLGYMRGSDVWEAFHASLPEAGNARGLRRMFGTAAAGNLRAKTGTIQNVSSLSGYVRAANGEWLAFSIIANGVPSTWREKRSEDAIGARLAAFRRPPPPAPAPAPAPEPLPMPVVPSPSTPTARAPAVVPAAAQTAPRIHVLREGETMDGVARRFGTTASALQQANPSLRPRRLQIGDTIRLPR